MSVASMVRIKAKATGIGERSGPAVAVTLRLVNRTKGVVDLDSTSVTATVLQGHEPTSRVEQVSRPGFAGRLRPGATATAAYAFSLPPGAGKRIVLAVSPSPDRPVVQLVGTLA